MTPEARLAFILLFSLLWCLIGLVPWAAAAVLARGRGALLALPVALTAAVAAGVLVPAAGLRDATGFFVSLITALAGGTLGATAGIYLARRLAAGRRPPSSLN